MRTLNEALPSAFGVTVLEALGAATVPAVGLLIVTGGQVADFVVLGIAVVVGGFLTLGGLHIASRGLEPFATAHEVGTTDPVPVADVAATDGPVAVQGTVEPRAETVESEYTETRCVAHRSRRIRRRKHPVTSWRTLEEHRVAVPFDVDDGSGRAAVDPAEADLTMETENVDDFLTRQIGGRRVESCLEPRETVHVYGRPRVDGETVTFAGGETPLLIADTNENWTVWRHLKAGTRHLFLGLPIALAGLVLLRWAVALYA